MRGLEPIIDEEPPGPGARWHQIMHGRRLLLAVSLAATEAVLMLAWRPGFLWVVLGAAGVLALAIGLVGRTPAGTRRDALIVVGGAQAILILLPLVIGFGVVVAVVVGVLLVVGVVSVVVAKRR
ncbi:MAG: hypothetical protein EXQ74_04730 [Thermoleophilia bacterium]|nr:hypothetical protein [Thermoleophilia bacterium]